MANVDRPNGFTPYTHHLNQARTVSIVPVTVSATNTKIAKGDPLKKVDNGRYDLWTTGTTFAGVAMSNADANSGSVIDANIDPEQLWVVQTDNGTGTLTSESGLGLNATMVAATSTGLHSIFEIDESSGATSSALELRIIKLYPAPFNQYGEFNRLVVKVNNHLEKQSAVTGV